MRDFSQSDQLRKVLVKLCKRDKTTYEAVLSKIQEIITCQDIDHYKNLKRPLQHFKRVHVGSFVLLFKHSPVDDSIEFVVLSHHDEAYL